MATKMQNLKWKLYKKKEKILFSYGISKGLIHAYEKDFIEHLRHVYYGGVPASIILLCRKLCERDCYDRALLATFGFGDDDFQLVDADVDYLTLQPRYADGDFEHIGNHCFAERTKKDGTTWVYDTTLGLVIEKVLYYKMQRPKITKTNSKQATQAFCDYVDIKNADFEHDKYVLPFVLPNIEVCANTSDKLYREVLKQEIDRFKKEIDSDGLCEEINQDMIEKGFRKGLGLKK